MPFSEASINQFVFLLLPTVPPYPFFVFLPSFCFCFVQGVAAASWADDPDLAERLFEAWLERADISQVKTQQIQPKWAFV